MSLADYTLTYFSILIENTYVYPCVVRHSDMTDVEQDEPMDDDESMHSVHSEHGVENQFPFHEHVDMADSPRQKNVSRRSQKRRESLYDFGCG